MDNEEYKETLVGGEFVIKILQEEALFEYFVYKNNELLWTGDTYETYDEVINELSAMHEALRAIFG
jgi:hypothetical protein